jgi:hypothetical protein
MEERATIQESPPSTSEAPPRKPMQFHKPYPIDHRRAILEAYATWKGTTDEFCAVHNVYKGTLWAWRRRMGPKAQSAMSSKLLRFSNWV